MKNLEYRKNICVFIDILGYKNLVNKATSEEEALSTIKRLEEVINECIVKYINSKGSDSEEINYEIFSDSIIITSPIICEESDPAYSQYIFNKVFLMTLIVAGIQMQSIIFDILFRGAISIGNHYRSENIMFSKALVNAYDAESKQAIYPRVIYDITNFQQENVDIINIAEELIEMGLVVKDEDYYFVDFIGRINSFRLQIEEVTTTKLQELKRIITEGLEKFEGTKVESKYVWLAKYFNFKLIPCLEINPIHNKNIESLVVNFKQARERRPGIIVEQDGEIEVIELQPGRTIFL